MIESIGIFVWTYDIKTYDRRLKYVCALHTASIIAVKLGNVCNSKVNTK